MAAAADLAAMAGQEQVALAAAVEVLAVMAELAVVTALRPVIMPVAAAVAALVMAATAAATAAGRPERPAGSQPAAEAEHITDQLILMVAMAAAEPSS